MRMQAVRLDEFVKSLMEDLGPEAMVMRMDVTRSIQSRTFEVSLSGITPPTSISLMLEQSAIADVAAGFEDLINGSNLELP